VDLVDPRKLQVAKNVLNPSRSKRPILGLKV
jgi:hypothetical protein